MVPQIYPDLPLHPEQVSDHFQFLGGTFPAKAIPRLIIETPQGIRVDFQYGVICFQDQSLGLVKFPFFPKSHNPGDHPGKGFHHPHDVIFFKHAVTGCRS